LDLKADSGEAERIAASVTGELDGGLASALTGMGFKPVSRLNV